jgi:hypothetical protein
MKRIITIGGKDGGIQLEVRATIKTKGLTRYESERVVKTLANNLFSNIDVPYADFGAHNLTVSL